MNPGPKPWASMSNACRELTFAESLPASLASRRKESAGISSASITANEPIASGHGRALTASLQRRHIEARPSVCARCPRRLRATRCPKRERTAGSSVSEAVIVTSTASAEAIASPYMKLTPVANMPSSAITTVVPASRIARPDVSIAAITDRSTSPSAR